MFVVSCLVMEIKTVIAAQSAKLLGPHQKEITLSLLFSFPFGALWLHLGSVFKEIACLMGQELLYCIGP